LHNLIVQIGHMLWWYENVATRPREPAWSQRKIVLQVAEFASGYATLKMVSVIILLHSEGARSPHAPASSTWRP
jgi:hypothetical protein